MYTYTEFDRRFLRERVAQFRAQVRQRLDGAMTEDEFKPIRLMNGLYLQLHAYMLRVAIPYGSMRPDQLRQLAMIAERWDKGYGHFTTRQNVQFNWPRLMDVPDMLDALADVGMHAIQTSGNTIRNVTSDHFAGAAADEIEDPRPVAELVRQWSTDHPEFQSLPRKFKIAVTGSPNDRAVVKSHDIGLRMVRDGHGRTGFEVTVGGGLGRTPMVAKVLRPYLPKADLLPYLEAALRVYNRYGRRDNKYKARIKILVHEEGIERIAREVEAEFRLTQERFHTPSDALLSAIAAAFVTPDLAPRAQHAFDAAVAVDPQLAAFAARNVAAHRVPGHAIVTVSLKKPGETPGDASADQMRALAHIAERFGNGEVRVSHEQNLVLPHVALDDLPAVFASLQRADLATPNAGLASDIIACPGMDYCALATARSIPVAQQIATRFQRNGLDAALGDMKIKISGCINACGHHHVGHIGILGLDRAGVENYQITLGGDATQHMAVGERAGPGFASHEIVDAVERLARGYLALRAHDETFIETYRRLGAAPFREALYGASRAAA